MSTLITENLQDSGGFVPVATVRRGAAKAWVSFNGTGTISLRDSLNVSSLLDNGTGDYTVSYSNSFDNANYCYVFGGTLNRRLQLIDTGAGATLSSIRVQGQNNASTAFDTEVYNAAICGDLA